MIELNFPLIILQISHGSNEDLYQNEI